VEMCKPSVTALMLGTAAGLCQVLGYHRYQTMKDDTEEDRNNKIHIFWMIYVFDKTMSLRLGRASFIQDWDISLPYFGDSREATDVPDGKQMLTYWVKVARVQGQTYEKLFSPAAFLHPPEERTRIAIELVNALNQAWYERGDACVTDLADQTSGGYSQQSALKNSSPIEAEQPSKRRDGRRRPLDGDPDQLDRIEDVFFFSDVVMHYSTCSLVQRAVSPDNVTFNQECLESARAALVAHMRCSIQYNTKENEELWNGYIHWSILQAPFTP
jgi:hypothetical protein